MNTQTQPKQILYSPVDIDDAEFAEFEADPRLEEENLEFEKFRAEMHDTQDDAKITVGKKLTDSRGRPMGKQTFECFECGIEDYTFSQLCTRIREDFGTGLYLIVGRDSKGKYKFRKVVGVQAPNSLDDEPAGTDVGMLIDKFSDAMQRQQLQTEQMFAKLSGPQTGGDAFDQMTKMMTAMGGMMGAMGVSPQAPKSMLDQLTEFKMLQELFRSGDGDNGGGELNITGGSTVTVGSEFDLHGPRASQRGCRGLLVPRDQRAKSPRMPTHRGLLVSVELDRLGVERLLVRGEPTLLIEIEAHNDRIERGDST